MNEQFYRLCFHMRRTASSLRSKLFPFSLNKILESANDLAATVEEIEEFRELDKRLQQEYEEHIRSEPVLIPQNTMYFGGGRNKKRVNFLNADHYRAEIKKAYTWAIRIMLRSGQFLMVSMCLLSIIPSPSVCWHWKYYLTFAALARLFDFTLSILHLLDI